MRHRPFTRGNKPMAPTDLHTFWLLFCHRYPVLRVCFDWRQKSNQLACTFNSIILNWLKPMTVCVSDSLTSYAVSTDEKKASTHRFSCRISLQDWSYLVNLFICGRETVVPSLFMISFDANSGSETKSSNLTICTDRAVRSIVATFAAHWLASRSTILPFIRCLFCWFSHGIISRPSHFVCSAFRIFSICSRCLIKNIFKWFGNNWHLLLSIYRKRLTLLFRLLKYLHEWVHTPSHVGLAKPGWTGPCLVPDCESKLTTNRGLVKHEI